MSPAPNRRPDHRQPPRQEPPAMQEIHAPYNFVPVSEWVNLLPEADARRISQDVPFSDGLSGFLDLEIIAHTPLLVGGDHPRGQVTPYRLPGAAGAYAIPGTSIRGMIRNVLEIASFSRMRFVDDRWYSIRDLAGPASESYRHRMTEDEDVPPEKVAFRLNSRWHGKKVKAFKPTSKGGWLVFHDGVWKVLPCAYARVEQHLLDMFFGENWFRDNRDRRRTAPDKYRYAYQRMMTLRVSFKLTEHLAHEHSGDKFLYYRKVNSLAGPNTAGVRGTLVFTGQPGPNKHMEFVFTEGKADAAIVVPEDIIRGFLQIHRDTSEWNFWASYRRQGKPIPVFYLPNNSGPGIKALGLAQMFKLPYDRSIHRAVPNPESHFGETGMDFAESLFGFARNEDSLRSRLNFSLFTAQGQPRLLPEVQTVLNGPKPTFYPNYMEQPGQDTGRLRGGNYRTLMDLENQPSPRIRGWKRYPVRSPEQVEVSPPPPNAGDAVQVRLQALDGGARFTGKLRFHNLRPAELGALVWVATWGGKLNLRHALGMGKPFGWGQVELKVNGQAILRNDGKDEPIDLDGLAGLFADHMDRWMKGRKPGQSWLAHPAMVELLAMADPERARGKELTHLSLAGREFVQAKNSGLVLRPYTKQARR